MRKGPIFFIVVGFASFVLQASCTNKIASVSGTSGLQDERKGRAEDSVFPLREEGIEKEEMTFSLNEDSEIREGLVDGAGKTNEQPPTRSGVSEIPGGLVDVFFDYNKASLKSDSKVALQDNARNLILHPLVHIQIAGHTDERGSSEYNLALGARRARAVKRFLQALGVSPDRMDIISYGEESPFCKKSQKSCWQSNRRAHFMIQPKE